MKSLWIVSSLIVYLYAWFGFAADKANHDGEVILFIGNPGVGKSTLINLIIGQHVAEPGVSAGEGLNKLFQSYYHQGKTYIDTPGLSDTKIRVQAAKEIEKDLKMNSNYRIFFMLTLSGRVKTDDVNSINRIMESVKFANKSFNIIINKINKKELAEIFKNPQKIEEVYTQLNSGNHKTRSIFYIEIDRNIEEEDTEFIVIYEKLNQFLHQDSLSFFLD